MHKHTTTEKKARKVGENMREEKKKERIRMIN
jgi:hypothetical protein